MLLPTRIVHPHERTPYVTYTLLGLNVAAFLLTFTRIERGLDELALNTEAFEAWQPFTSMFLHVGFLHLVGNMIFLAVFGRYVEERLGPWRYLGAYLLFGLLAGAAWAATEDGKAVGASGAISGLMGFVFVGAPFVKVRVLWVFWVYVYFVAKKFDLPALWLVGLWILFQLFRAWSAGPFDRVAYAAHLGGFAAGCGLAAFLKSDTCKGTSWWLDDALPGGGEAATRRLQRARRSGRAPAARPAAAPGHAVTLRALAVDASPVAVIKLLMKRRGLAPEEAKVHVDAIQAGEGQRFVFDEPEPAERFRVEAEALGVDAASGPA